MHLKNSVRHVRIVVCLLIMSFVSSSSSLYLLGQDANAKQNDPESIPLFHAFDEAVEQAKKMDRPLLVILGAVWCAPCKQLEKDLELPMAGSIFKQWIVVKVDIDEEPALAKEWQVGAVPAFRILGVEQEVVASNEGFGGLKKLQSWLSENLETADPKSQRLLLDDKPVDAKLITELLAMLRDKRPSNRKLIAARLVKSKDLAAGPVVAVLLSGNLSQKIAALEILEKWSAPIAGIDPWEPDTISGERLTVLNDWLSSDQDSLNK